MAPETGDPDRSAPVRHVNVPRPVMTAAGSASRSGQRRISYAAQTRYARRARPAKTRALIRIGSPLQRLNDDIVDQHPVVEPRLCPGRVGRRDGLADALSNPCGNPLHRRPTCSKFCCDDVPEGHDPSPTRISNRAAASARTASRRRRSTSDLKRLRKPSIGSRRRFTPSDRLIVFGNFVACSHFSSWPSQWPDTAANVSSGNRRVAMHRRAFGRSARSHSDPRPRRSGIHFQ
jgi:hypothetical protein